MAETATFTRTLDLYGWILDFEAAGPEGNTYTGITLKPENFHWEEGLSFNSLAGIPSPPEGGTDA